MPVMADHDDCAAGVRRGVFAHRTEQDADGLTMAAAADNQEVGIFGLIDGYLSRRRL